MGLLHLGSASSPSSSSSSISSSASAPSRWTHPLSLRRGWLPATLLLLFCLSLLTLHADETSATLSSLSAASIASKYDELRARMGSSSSNHQQQWTASQVQAIEQLEPEWRWAANASIVYTWVNGSDPAYQALRKEHGGELGTERDRDNDDLRFSLRSLEKYLPWHVGTVYLVSPSGQVPSWLDSSNPRFVHVDQNSLIPIEDQPTFNSNVVEAWLFRIPGLTEQFIGMNDDYFFKSYIHPSRFFTKERGVQMYLEPWFMGLAADRGGERQWEKSIRNTARVIREAYTTIYHQKTRITEHCPFIFDVRALSALHSRFNHALRLNGQHKFRHAEDSIVPILHYQYIVQEGSRCCGLGYEVQEGKSPFFQWELDMDVNERKWDELQKDERWFWHNVNDGMGDSSDPALVRKAQDQLKRKMREKYPLPSSFEKSDMVASPEAGHKKEETRALGRRAKRLGIR